MVPGVTEVTASLEKHIGALTESDLVLPKMPDGMEVTGYCDLLVSRTQTLIFDSLSFLPEIDFSLLLHGHRNR
jgi:hypothetical protein